METETKKEVELYVPRFMRERQGKLALRKLREREKYAFYKGLLGEGFSKEEALYRCKKEWNFKRIKSVEDLIKRAEKWI